MPDLTAKRTLVKSPPELWEELSEVDRLAKHLGAFGEIKITKLEPEHTVAWEGEHASGTVSIEPSGWGTKVTLHAELPADAVPEPVKEEPEPSDPGSAAEVAPELPVEHVIEAPPPEMERRGFWGWLFRTRTQPAALAPEPVEPEPEPVAIEPEPEPEVVEPVAVEVEEEPSDSTLDPDRAMVVLDEALDALGAAHHRPFSRG
jgi:hypothetical protein